MYTLEIFQSVSCMHFGLGGSAQETEFQITSLYDTP